MNIILLIVKKELTVTLRDKATGATMIMFALTALSLVGLSLQGASLPPHLSAAFLWIIIFFAGTAGINRIFADEETSGTLLTLKIFGEAGAVLFGKMAAAMLNLAVLSFFVLPLFVILMNQEIADIGVLLAVAVGGIWGIASAGTLVGSLVVGAKERSGLFCVLMLPVVLPVLIPAVSVTAAAFGARDTAMAYLGGIYVYDAILSVGASLLFDYIWYED